MFFFVQFRVAGYFADRDETNFFTDKDLAVKNYENLLKDNLRGDPAALSLTTMTFQDGVGVGVLEKDGGIFRWAESSDGENWDQGDHLDEDEG